MNDRRRALIALLDQYPLERDLYLHDGRRDVSPRDEFAEKIEALYAPSSDESHIDYVMGGSRPLLERYHDALEVVRKQAIIIQELEATPSLFQRVMEASETYVTRFKGEIIPSGAVTKFSEEVEEFKEAIDDTALFSSDTRQHLLEECIDVMVTMGGVLSCYGIQWSEIDAAARAKLKKLDERTTDDYVWDPKSKTVIKRSKLEVQS
jgi:hypothetical protein